LNEDSLDRFESIDENEETPLYKPQTNFLDQGSGTDYKEKEMESLQKADSIHRR